MELDRLTASTIKIKIDQGDPTMISNGRKTATLAQLVEHSPCKRTVVSSNLTGGSKYTCVWVYALRNILDILREI